VIDPGTVGSPTDVATLLVSLVVLVRLRADQGDGHAAIVAIAEHVPGVDAAHIRGDLDVPERESAAYHAVTDGGTDGAD